MKTKLNYAAEQIKHVYNYKSQQRTKIIQEFIKRSGLQPKHAFGNIYFNIGDVFTDTTNVVNKEAVFNDIRGYGGVDFLGNINEKTQYQLYFKSAELKKHFKYLIYGLQNLFDDSQEALKTIRETHGEPNVQHAILAHY
ncbi:MAG: hypothetical protein ACQERX_06260 [Bacillota bacterium]